MLPVESPFKVYTGLDGKPLDRGYVYFGVANQNPITSPVTVYWDAAGTQPAAQPLRTENGYIMRAGTPANVFYDGAYSELVQDNRKRQVFYARTSDDFSIATLVLDFIADLAASGGAALMGFIQAGTGAILRTALAKLRAEVSVDDFGALGDGVTDDAAAVRLALDSLPARGGVVRFEKCGPYLIGSVVYIPQRTSIFGSGGIRILGRNTTLTGSGANTIFESGTGSFSTVALGGATNFGQANESVASIHYNSSLEGFNFLNCGAPVRLFNWLQGCVLRDLYATNFTTMIETLRCFYLGLESIEGRPLQDARAATTPIFKFVDSNNTMTFMNVHCSGITSGGVAKGVGWEFDSGVQGVTLPGGCSSEGCIDAVLLKSIIYSMKIDGFYFEANTTAIRSSGANLLNLVIDNCEFEANTTDINVDNWIDGYFGSSNKTTGAVTFGIGCTHTVELPVQSLSEVTHTNWLSVPASWTVPGGCEVIRNDMIYNSATGFSAPWFRNAGVSSGNSGIVPAAYTGDCFNVGDIIPYCTVTGVGGVTLVVTTKIKYAADLSAVRFDIRVVHGATAIVAGVLSAGDTIFRDDATAFTVVASDSGGFLRLTLGGFGVITSYSGKVRVI